MNPKSQPFPQDPSADAKKAKTNADPSAVGAENPIDAAGAPRTGRHRRGRGKPVKKSADTEADAAAADAAEDTSAEDSATERTSAPTPSSASADGSLVVPPGKTVVIGITGEPGAGKSALARQLAGLGGELINVDEIGHELIETTPVKRRLVEEFGDDIVNDDGEIDRRKLGAKAFANAESTAKLNEIVHPKLTAKVKALVKKSGNFIIIDAGLLHELGLAEICTTTIYVRASRESRVNRVAERGWDESELTRREAALGNADARRKACQLAVDNSGDPALLAAYAKTILARQLGVDLSALRRQKENFTQNNTAQESNQENDSANDSDSGEDNQDHDQASRAPISEVRTEVRSDHRPERSFEPRHGGHREQQQGDQRPRFGDNRPGFNDQRGGEQRPAVAQPGQPGQAPNPGAQGFDANNRPPVKVDLDDYLKRILPDLQAEADKLEVRDVKWLKKHDLISEILRRVTSGRQDEIIVEGFIELVKDQQGYIRSPLNQYLAVNTDTFITNQQIRRYGLKEGMHVTGTARSPRGNERCPQLIAIQTIMGEPIDKRTPVQDFEHLTPLHAHDRLFMELPNDPTDLSLRIIDLVSPIGKGQRGLIVAQPKCGKTVYMQKIAKAITTNNPEVILMVLLVDERPEEVTDMQRSVKGEVIASTFDQHASRHVQCAEMVINKAKRLVERGKDVVILLDSITRLARAYNTMAPNSGRILSGGIDSNALIKPKQFFGAARKIENGGSLTILATAIVDTGSLMDTVIFEEFKGTGNMELVLDRRLANRRVFPAVDCAASGTRKDELLIKDPEELKRVWALRKFLADRNGADAVEFMRSKLKNYRTNVEFLMSIDPDKLSGW